MIPRRHAAAEVYNDKLYIIGGSTTSVTKSAIKSIQVADISENVLANTTNENRVLETKVYTNASKDGFIISNKNNSNQFEYTVYSTGGEVVSRGFAYYNKTIDLSRVRPWNYIFSFKNEKGVLQQIKIFR